MSYLRNYVELIIRVRATVPWLRHALESIAAQYLQPHSITVIDDAVEAPEVIHTLGTRLSSERFRLIKSSGHGISAALNTAMEASDAYLIARMDADDSADPARLSNQLDLLLAHSGPVIA